MIKFGAFLNIFSLQLPNVASVALCSLMWKATLVCFLMTLQHIGIEFSHRTEADGRASWCTANWEMKTCMMQKRAFVVSVRQCDHTVRNRGIWR